jgi:hypothetical protein
MYLLEAASARRATRGADLKKAERGVCINRPPAVTFRTAVTDPATNQGGGPPLITLVARGDALELHPEISDDGLPRGGRISAAWRQVSGPGTASFEDTQVPSTLARFSALGTYELEIATSDSQLTSTTRVRVIVRPAETR